MNVRMLCALVLVCSAALAAEEPVQAPAAGSGPGMSGYSSMEIDAGRMKGNFATGAIDEMTDGVKIRLLSDDPDKKPLPIRAQTMKFTWKEGQSTPSTIVMDKNVEVNHPDAQITAGHAEWNFDSGEVVFTGDPVVNNDKIKGLRGEKMILNVKTNNFEVTRVRADQVPLQGMDAGPGGKGDPSLLREGDVKDWAALISLLRTEAKADGAAPGKQIVSQISADNRQLLMSVDTAVLLQRKGDIVKLVNSVLKSPKLYSEAAWQGRALSEEAQKLIAAEKRTPEEQTRLNRLLLSAAYPELVAAP
jgi:hypothetical protein